MRRITLGDAVRPKIAAPPQYDLGPAQRKVLEITERGAIRVEGNPNLWDSEHFYLAEPNAPFPANPKAAYGALKPDLALIPPVALIHESVALEMGAAAYGAYNFRERPVEAMTYAGAAMRHLVAWLDGEDYDSDGVHNLGAVRACCGIVLDGQESGTLIDNRPPKGKAGEAMERIRAAKADPESTLARALARRREQKKEREGT